MILFANHSKGYPKSRGKTQWLLEPYISWANSIPLSCNLSPLLTLHLKLASLSSPCHSWIHSIVQTTLELVIFLPKTAKWLRLQATRPKLQTLYSRQDSVPSSDFISSTPPLLQPHLPRCCSFVILSILPSPDCFYSFWTLGMALDSFSSMTPNPWRLTSYLFPLPEHILLPNVSYSSLFTWPHDLNFTR